jgi:ABC-2 type transport system permease protein
MINFNRVFAMVYRYTINLRHNFDRLSDMFYWPALDLFVWGLTGLYFARLSSQFSHSTEIILTGVIFWIVIWRAQYEITTNLLSEMWDYNLVNVFMSPLTVIEWIIAVMIYGFFKMIVSISFSAMLAFFIYGYSVFTYGFYLLPIILSLLLTGWVAGFIVAGFIIRYGTKIQTTAWMGVSIIAPFSALYYPVSILPQWAQKISIFIPSSYIFENMRQVLLKGTISYDKLIISFLLNIAYLVFSISFFVWMFKKSRKLGFGRLI